MGRRRPSRLEDQLHEQDDHDDHDCEPEELREADERVVQRRLRRPAGDERLLDLAVDKRIVEKSGAWFAYDGERLGQGRENAKQFLKENLDVYRAIEERVRRELGMIREVEPATV